MYIIWRDRCRQMLPNLLPGGLRALAGATLCLYAFGAVGFTSPSLAAELGRGELHLSLDTTLSHGLTFRIQEQDDLLTSDVNGNDGNLNYSRGLVSNTSKFTSDLDLGYRNFGAFLRINGFLDFENENGARERTPLSDEAKELVGQDIILLDAYLTGAFEVGNVAIDLRLGRHVLNWGESTFIQNGINTINPFDVSKLRLPGSELREALMPVSLVSASVGLTDTLSMEGFYQLDWENTKIDPVGTYFSVTDYVGPGAEKAVIALPGLDLGDMGLTAENNPFAVFGVMPDPDFLTAKRGTDHEPDDSGQWGIAFRYLAEALNNTEFGFYYMNYHSRLPVVGGHTGTLLGATNGLARVSTAAAPIVMLAQIFGGAVQIGNIPAALMALSDAATREVPGAEDAAARFRAAVSTGNQTAIETATSEIIEALTSIAKQAAPLGIDTYVKTGHYFVEYPEDIQLFGVSFNTEIGASGWALQGEYSFRQDAPLQLAERRVFADALGPFTGCLAQGDAAATCISENAVAGLYDADVAGFILRDVSQMQATATKVFGPVLGSDSGVFLTEVATMHVHNMPGGKGVATTNPDGSPNPAFADAIPIESPAGEPDDDPTTNSSDADGTSWGYRLATRLDYNNAIGAVNLFPYLQLQHDISGNSPAPSGSFVEGRTALTLGVRAGYLSRWEADLNFTTYGGKENELHDRDFVSVTVKYSF